MVLVFYKPSTILVFYKLNSAIESGTKPDALGWKPCHWTSTFEFISLSLWYDAPLTSRDRDRRHGITSKIRGWKSMPWRVATMKESGHNSSRSASLPLLEPEALCLKTLTCPALPMNGHASWSSSC